MENVSSVNPSVEEYRDCSLARCFNAKRVEPRGSLPELERELSRMLALARDAWTELLPADAAPFVEHLARCVRHDADDVVAELAGHHVQDLFLAWCCATGNPDALRAFDRAYLAEFSQEVRQHLFDLLFTGEPSARKILQYAGRSPLCRWVSVIARNFKVSEQRHTARTRTVDRDGWERLQAACFAPENELARKTHGKLVEAALAEALQGLSARDRRVLRLVIVEQMSLPKVALLYHVHRSTVWHWVEKLAQQLRDEIEQHLRASGVPTSDVASIVRLMRSQIDVGLSATHPTDTESMIKA